VTEIWVVLLISLLPGVGNLAGGLLAEFAKHSPRVLNWALHGASGIIIAVVAIELMPRALQTLQSWWIAGAFAAGGLAYIGLDALVDRAARASGRAARSSMWMIYIAIAMDLTSDGLMIGTGSALSTGLALVLASGQTLADLPEGYAAIANFRSNGVRRRVRLMLSASFLLYVTAAALISYLALHGASEGVKAAALVFVAGVLTVAAVEDMLEEAHAAREDSRRSVLAFVGGFALFTVVSSGLETFLSR